ncbi:MAG: hexokinase-domain-containing protein [Podila humilis]|nr:MAG: hexokinase-domain-containing protein [Podila humilis]
MLSTPIIPPSTFHTKTLLARTPINADTIRFISQEQKDAVADLIKDLTVGSKSLSQIKDHFVGEMKKGLSKDGETLAMVPTYVMGRLDGSETGTYLTLDLGGTFLRVVFVELLGQGKFNARQKKYRVDEGLKVGEATVLFDFAAASVVSFLDENGIKVTQGSELELGFTFSYPVLQTSINSGTLITWTKGFQAGGLVKNDPAAFLQNAFTARGVPIRVAALINDTVGTLLAHAYQHPDTYIGLGFGTGTNGAYLEQIDRITKWDGDRQGRKEMIINMEFGAFDNERTILPFTKYDTILDNMSLNPGEQLFEKMIAGMYLGEVARSILLDLKECKFLFQLDPSWALDTMWSFDTAHMSVIEADNTLDLGNTEHVLATIAQVAESTLVDRQIVKVVVQLVGKRAARLSSMALAGILDHLGLSSAGATKQIAIGVDGSLYQFYPDFERDIMDGLCDVLGPQVCSQVSLDPSLDGSSVGAALAAALAKSK